MLNKLPFASPMAGQLNDVREVPSILGFFQSKIGRQQLTNVAAQFEPGAGVEMEPHGKDRKARPENW
jgi:hypothetical protein